MSQKGGPHPDAGAIAFLAAIVTALGGVVGAALKSWVDRRAQRDTLQATAEGQFREHLLRAQAQQAEAEGRLRSVVAAADEAILVWRTRYGELWDKHQALHEECAEERRQHGEAKDELARLREEIAWERARANTLAEQVTRLIEQVTALQEECERLRHSLPDVEIEIDVDGN